MPASTLAFRATCGTFYPTLMCILERKVKLFLQMRMNTTQLSSRLEGVLFGFTLVYLFWGSLLLQCGDIELNPGPSDNSTAAKGTRSRSVTGSGQPSNQKPSPDTEPTLRDVVAILAKMSDDNQKMSSNVESVKSDVSDIKEQQTKMLEEVESLKDDVENLMRENQELRSDRDALLQRVASLEKKTDDLEGRSKRSNVIVYGIPREDGESTAKCEELLNNVCKNDLRLREEIPFDRVHRLSNKADAPIIAKCTFYRDKVKILKSKKLLQGTNIFVGEDYPVSVREIRKKINQLVKDNRQRKEKVRMVYDHVYIENKKYFLSDDGSCLVEESVVEDNNEENEDE